MRAYRVFTGLIGAALVLLAGSSASEAGSFRGRYTCYYYPTDSTLYAATNPAPAQTVVPASSGPVVRQTYKPVTGVEQMPAAPPAATNYAPRAMSGNERSVIPRSSWDFGRLPPYR